MKPVMDLEKEYGLVLEGGGAKGAYQIGVWKAFLEAGVKIKGIAGTSVGGLNGAFICMGSLDAAVHIWENLTYSRIMSIPDKVAEGVIHGTLNMSERINATMKFLKNGGVDVTPLRELIEGAIDPQVIKASPMELYVTTFNVDEMKEEQINLKEVEDSLVQDYLMATAYMAPVFKVEKLHGVRYIDCGALDNVPIGILLDQGYKDIIVVRIYGVGNTKKVEIPEDVSVREIAPKNSLGSVLEFDGKRSKRNIVRGYLDGMRAIYGLPGLIYYLDEEEVKTEPEYLKWILSVDEETMEKILSMHHQESVEDLWMRRMTEKILPAIALELKLGTDWNYHWLFLSMLEATAKLCRISKNKIYTIDDLLIKIADKSKVLANLDAPDFACIIMNLAKQTRK